MVYRFLVVISLNHYKFDMALISGKKVSTSLLILAACVLGVGIGLFALNYWHATKCATEKSPDEIENLMESLNRRLLQSESQV